MASLQLLVSKVSKAPKAVALAINWSDGICFSNSGSKGAAPS